MRLGKSIISCAFGMIFAAGVAQAHYLWFETDVQGSRLYFGEAEGDLREKSPGKLDTIKAPRALALDTASGRASVLPLNRTAGYFALAGGDKATAILAAEESLEVRDLTKHGLGMAKPNYYARHGRPKGSEEESALALDVQGNDPNRLTVLYRGQPLKSAKVKVIAPNTWMQEHKTDAQGRVAINTPWRGRYVVHVLHVDASPDEFGGKAYDVVRNHFTYSFNKPEGADAGPALPPRQGMD